MGSTLSYCDTTDAAEPPTEPPTEPPAESEENTTEQAEAPEAKDTPRTYPKRPKFWAPPQDPRFRSVNQARTCYTRYNEFYKCKLEKDEDSEECLFYKRCYESICPTEWIERWEGLREEGLWAGRY